MFRRLVLMFSVVAVMLSAVVPVASATGARVMVVGDSISQGHEGDYTWRYRLAEHLGRTSAGVDFVGPWTGTDVLPASYPPGWPDVPNPPSRDGAYRPGVSFDSQHLAQWGWQMHQAKDVIAAQVRTHTPDYLLVELGFNDLGWGVNGPAGVLNDLKWLIANARSAKPGIRVVVANVVHRTPLGSSPTLPQIISSYNSLLAAEIANISTTASPVALADLDTPYDENRDTYDGLHPNVRGEYVIAKAFGDALATRFSVGSAYGAIPSSLPANLTPGAPATISATPVGDKVKISWSHVFGAAGYQFFQRDATVGQAFAPAMLPIGADSWISDLLPAGHRMEFYVKTMRGEGHISAGSPVTGATVAALPGLKNLVITTDPAMPYAVTLKWDPVPGADDYHVYAAPGCGEDPAPLSDYKLQQWGLGTKTTWTQEYVFGGCTNYIVAGSRYGGESKWPWAGIRAWPYENNYGHLLARNRYFDTAPDDGDKRAETSVSPSTDRGIVVARGYIRNKDTFTDLIGDHRGFDNNPYASSKIAVAWDTKTGEIGVYVHQSCVIGGSNLPSPWVAGCRDAHPIQFVGNALAYGDTDKTPVNYVSVLKQSDGSLEVSVSAVNSWSNFLGRINGKVTLRPSGNTYAATLQADKFPAWEIYRYPRTAVLGSIIQESYTIGTRDQTSIDDLKGGYSFCTSPATENKNDEVNPMNC
ncbi:SGNH/GDSL hydrolase family protein [Amycolatopsis sp. NPDC059657]|uniref:SGNH/GDSL hydrolase family protein n=1 Tax=Amycolatopsis sp. NPDC059657 TaxID=3346899 RepID=UPI00366CE058